MVIARKPVSPATYADIEALPPGLNGEIIAGELVATPRPAARHALASSTLGSALLAAFQRGLGGPGGWWIIDEPELSLAADPLFDPVIPDLAGWRLETMPEHPITAQYHVSPDWVCEVLSPSTARRDRALKLPYYARAGVGHSWLLDPVAQTLELFELDRASERYALALTASAEDVVEAPRFGAMSLDLSVIWRGR